MSADEYVIRWTRGGVFDGNFGPFADLAAAEFFEYATRSGGKPGRDAEILTMSEFQKRNGNRPPVDPALTRRAEGQSRGNAGKTARERGA